MSQLESAACNRAKYALDLMSRLIAEPSVEGSEAIERCLDLVELEIQSLAREVRRPENDGLTSLIARFGPAGSPLAFSGHVDVVPAGGKWATPPFELTRKGDRLRGRGTCDMKGAVAAFVAAIHALDDAGELDRVPLELVLTGDEEVGSRRGLIPLLEAGEVTAVNAVCGEPTGLDLFLGNRGLIWIEITIRGRGGHAGMIHVLENALEPAIALARELGELPLDARDERFDPPAPTLTVTRLEGSGQAVNIVPDEATLAIDRRLVPGENTEPIIRSIADTAQRVCGGRFEHDLTVVREWPPYAIDADEELVGVAKSAVAHAGRPGRIGMDLASNDSSWLDQAGIKTLLLGPGDPEEAHTTDEALDVAQLSDAVVIYTDIAAAFAARESGS